MTGLGKFQRRRSRLALPFTVIFHLVLLFFIGAVALVALLQPLLWAFGRVTGTQAGLNFIVSVAVAIGLIGVVRLLQKFAVWIQP